MPIMGILNFRFNSSKRISLHLLHFQNGIQSQSLSDKRLAPIRRGIRGIATVRKISCLIETLMPSLFFR